MNMQISQWALSLCTGRTEFLYFHVIK
jgi:hypothetical protein